MTGYALFRYFNWVPIVCIATISLPLAIYIDSEVTISAVPSSDRKVYTDIEVGVLVSNRYYFFTIDRTSDFVYFAICTAPFIGTFMFLCILFIFGYFVVGKLAKLAGGNVTVHRML